MKSTVKAALITGAFSIAASIISGIISLNVKHSNTD